MKKILVSSLFLGVLGSMVFSGCATKEKLVGSSAVPGAKGEIKASRSQGDSTLR